ncbi:MAG: energy transducer TonB, partial [Terracidiphilus sp.]
VENDMQRGGVKARRDNAVCQQMSSLNVSDWVGTVATVDSNSDGKGVFSVNIAPDISVQTWNNAFSDIEDNTLMPPSSAVFNAASATKPGQSIIFSGTFLRGSEGDCLREGSMTLQGKVGSPEFIFRFSQVAPYTSSATAHLTEKSSPFVPSSTDDASTTPAAATQISSSIQDKASDTGNQVQHNGSAANQAVATSDAVATRASGNSGANDAAAKQADRVLSIPAALAADRLVAQLDPHYPPIAKAAGVSGTVVLRALITKDGRIGNLSVVSGPAMLQDSALEAVKLWRYRPYIVNNEPVEVTTTINVLFTLGG